MEILITKTVVKNIKNLMHPKEDLRMSKAALHNLIDMLNETDAETIYKVLIKFIPGVKPLDDEIEAIHQAEADIKNGDVFDLSSVNW